ncbi:MAG: hypothetical protein CMJ48_07835 [Planctomycetaceae bacterium]|nr:hypothetical protein [Planctomycetaceae bacterium]
MQPDPDLSDSACLKVPAGAPCIVYAEDTRSIALDLSKMPADRAAIAVDARKPYRERQLGRLPAKTQTWNAPYHSDWAIAIGNFQ